MTVFCGLCQCEVEGSWEEHVESQQHQDNLADPGKTGGAKVRHEMEFEERLKRTKCLQESFPRTLGGAEDEG